MVWTDLHATVHQTLKHRKLLSQEQAIVLAFSAGQDSMCLLQILRDLQPKWQWRLAIAHCDHRWPPDSGDNARHVAQLAQAWGLEYHSFCAPRVLKGEAEGRHWRYQVLQDLAQTQGFSAILTAHTASDRAETLLYNLFRGSGMAGLQALVWRRSLSDSVELIRPILNLTRQQTGDFCTQWQLPIWQDGMNQDRTYRRNQIRLDLLPMLKAQFNPQVEVALARTAEILQAETEYLDDQSKILLAQSSISTHHFSMPILAALDQSTLKHSPLALQRRALRSWLNQHLNLQPNFEQIEKSVALIHGNNGDHTDPLTGTIIAVVQRPWLCLCKLPN